MNYVGGKSRFGKEIWSHIYDTIIKKGGVITENTRFIDICCGSCGVLKHVPLKYRIANDLSTPLIAYLSKITQDTSWMYTENFLDNDMFNYIKHNQDKFSDYFCGYVGFCLSKNGSYFSGFKGTDKNYALVAYKSALKDALMLKDVKFYNLDYRSVPLSTDRRDIIYCDIPYKGTTQYHVGPFDYPSFFEWAAETTRMGHYVFISEYNKDNYMPAFCNEIWTHERISNMSNMSKARRKVKEDSIIKVANVI